MTEPNQDPKTRFEVVLLRLRDMILNGDLPPGSRVQEVAIGKRLGCSRTPVRNSLTVLEAEGLVRGEPNKGFTVREFTMSDVLAAYDVRGLLEGFACRTLAERGLSSHTESQLDECLSRGERLLAAGFFDATTIRAWTEMNGAFHQTIVSASDNPAVVSAVHLVNQHPLTAPSAIVFRTGNLERLYRAMQSAQEEHTRIVSALRGRQAVRAERLMAEHVFMSRENVREEVRERGLNVVDLVARLRERKPAMAKTGTRRTPTQGAK